MTIWTPKISDSSANKYVAIADAIAADVAEGTLRPGQKLPTQRRLAKRLGVTVGTVGRAYALAEKRGLISLEVGRGSFVRTFDSHVDESGQHGEMVDLGLNLPPQTEQGDLLARTLAQISNSRNIVHLFGDAPVESFEHHRAAAAQWLADRLPCSASEILICSGTQNALISILCSLATSQDKILVEELTFPGMIAAAQSLNLELVPVKMDGEGILPDELERQATGASILYCTPTNQNPTTATMSTKRRQQVASIARKLGLFIIEDDVYGKLVDDAPPPIASMAPERTYLVSSLAKTLSVGLRLAFVRAPSERRESLISHLRATHFFPAPLLCEVAASSIHDGTAERLLQEQRAVARRRQQLAVEILPPHLITGAPAGHHLWMELPAAWTATTLQRAANENGVNFYSAELFQPAGAQAVHAIRIALGAARNEGELRLGLNVISRLLSDSVQNPSARY